MALMIPAAAVACFATMADAVIRPAFLEFLWQQDADGRVWCHVECDTVSYTDPATGIATGSGAFAKNGAGGAFKIYFGPDLAPTEPQFWWPPGAVSQQPPPQRGQGRYGTVSRFDGVAANAATAGYTGITPRSVNQTLVFNLVGPGQPSVTLAAQHFINSGDLRIYAEFSYMVAP
jgi:hypothetical protein